MKKLIVAMMLSLCSTAVFAEELFCTLSVNMETVGEVQFKAEPQAKTPYLIADGFSFYVSNKGNSKFELEIFNLEGPSRSYAEGFLRSKEDTLAWTLWTRDMLLETKCKLAQ